MKFLIYTILAAFSFVSCDNQQPIAISTTTNQTINIAENQEQKKAVNQQEITVKTVLFEDKAENFAIKFPATPKKTKRTVNSEFGHIETTLYMVSNLDNDKNLVYTAAVSTYEGVDKFTKDKLNDFFDRRRQGALENFNGRIILEEIVELEGNAGRRYRMINDEHDIICVMWCYLVGDKFYLFGVIAPRKFDANHQMLDFLKSFELIEKTKLVHNTAQTQNIATQKYKDWHTIMFGENNCGEISVPKTWKIHDDVWNADITNKAGASASKKVTILRANDYPNSTFYIKLSTKKIDFVATKADINAEFLEMLDEEMQSLRQELIKIGGQVMKTTPAKFANIGNAFGGVYDYTYKNVELNALRKTVIYTLIIGSTYYNLTISWDDAKSKNPKETVNALLEKIKLCDW